MQGVGAGTPRWRWGPQWEIVPCGPSPCLGSSSACCFLRVLKPILLPLLMSCHILLELNVFTSARWLGKHFLLFKDSWVLVLEITQRFPPFFFVVRSHHVVGLFLITINSATALGSFHQHCNFPGLRHGESKSQCLEEGA